MKYYSLKYNSLNEIETGTQYQSTGSHIGDIQREIYYLLRAKLLISLNYQYQL